MEDEVMILYTDSSEAYDGFGTQTLEIVGEDIRNHRPIRKVSVREKALEWQRGRYMSGLHTCMNTADWEMLKPYILRP